MEKLKYYVVLKGEDLASVIASYLFPGHSTIEEAFAEAKSFDQSDAEEYRIVAVGEVSAKPVTDWVIIL